jgi:hypothetical protein
MKDTRTKAERIEENITLLLMIIGALYFIVMASRLFLNF